MKRTRVISPFIFNEEVEIQKDTVMIGWMVGDIESFAEEYYQYHSINSDMIEFDSIGELYEEDGSY